MSFNGFSREALSFLRELGRNNNREWFQAHRDEYEQLLLEPARDFVVAMGEGFEPFAKEVNADPRVNGSVSRINRDTRFSRDKRPYKTHQDLWFWQGSGPSRECPGYWFRLTTERLVLGAGMHRFQGSMLERYREAVVDPQRGKALQDTVKKLGSYDLGGRRYKRLPRGYEAPPEREELLLHDGLYAGVELPVPREAATPRFPAFCLKHYRRLAPLQEWLVALTQV